MLKIRLQRVGRKKIPAFRIVVAEHTMPVQGRFVEKLGNFISGRKKDTLQLKKERIGYWLSVGATPSQTIARLLLEQGMKEVEKFIKPRKQVPKKEVKKEEVKTEVSTDKEDKKSTEVLETKPEENKKEEESQKEEIKKEEQKNNDSEKTDKKDS